MILARGHSWTTTDYLIALVYDAVQDGSYVTAKVGGGRMTQPEHLPRPEDQVLAEAVRAASTSSALDYLERIRAIRDDPEGA